MVRLWILILLTQEMVKGSQLPMKCSSLLQQVTYHGGKDRQEQGGGSHITCTLCGYSNDTGRDQGNDNRLHWAQGLHLFRQPLRKSRSLGSTEDHHFTIISGLLVYNSSRVHEAQPTPFPILFFAHRKSYPSLRYSSFSIFACGLADLLTRFKH